MARFQAPRQPTRYCTRYQRFRGVDFSTDPALVDASRSPFAPNLISDAGGMPEKRPGWRTLKKLPKRINGIFEFQIGEEEFLIVHAGETLYCWQPEQDKLWKLIEPVTDERSQAFSMEGALYFLTGGEYIRVCEKDGKPWYEGSKTFAYAPLTSISRQADGGGTAYEEANLLTNRRRNSFCCDGTSKTYQLDCDELDDSTVECRIEGIAVAGFQTDRTKGTVTFHTPPSKPLVNGRDNLEITFGAAREAETNPIEKCTVCGMYASRVFVGGNPDKPAFDYRSAVGDPTYFPDRGYARIGSNSPIMGYLSAGACQAIVKAASAQEATVYLRQESLLDGKAVFPVRQGVGGVGAISKYAFGNLLDDPLFLSAQGVFALCAANWGEEKAVQNRSYYIDAALTRETGLGQASAVEWQGFYVLAAGGKCYLLDGGQEKSWRSRSLGDFLYECYCWENIPARCLAARGEALYFGAEDGRICRFNTDIEGVEKYNDDGEAIVCAWSTKADDDGSFAQYKTMDRRGSGVMIKPYPRSSIQVNLRTDRDMGRDVGSAAMDIWDWENIDFSRMDFNANDAPRVIPFGLRAGRYLTLQITVKNDRLNEGFGVYGIIKTFTREGEIK